MHNNLKNFYQIIGLRINRLKIANPVKMGSFDAYEYLKSLQPPQEIVDLYLAMMEVVFKAKEGDREEQIAKLKKQLVHHEDNLLKFDKQRFITGELEADSYKRLKSHTLEQIEKLKLDIQKLEVTDTAFEKYNRYGISLITHMDIYFAAASLEVNKKCLVRYFQEN